MTIVFYISVIFILHTYLFYPLLVRLLARFKKPVYVPEEKSLFPGISIVIAAYNEEKVIEKKLLSIVDTTYPLDKLEVWVGSDCSTDKTDEIVLKLAQRYSMIKLVRFDKRTGKSGILNQLVPGVNYEIVVLTDANVIFQPDTLEKLCRHFNNPSIVLAGANIINSRFKKEGISIQEETYISWENRTKYYEGILWGSMIGAFGGCYAIRKSWFQPVPDKFFMDDFFITMSVIERGGKCINDLEAVCFEDVSNKISEEFRRKIRISIGNFQNLNRFKKLLLKPWKGYSFAFWSHKVIRWFVPFLLILALVSNLFLINRHDFYRMTFIMQVFFLSLPFIDNILRSIKVHLSLLRYFTHFYYMNAALMVGFFKYLKGINSNIWQPTERFQ